MNKIQHFYNYLLATELITEQHLRVYADVGETKGVLKGDNQQDIVLIERYQVNILVSNWVANKLDTNRLKMAIIWWIAAYEQNNPELKWEADIKNKNTVDLWIGFLIEEKTFMKNNKIQTCMQQIAPLDQSLPNMPIFLRDGVTDDEIMLNKDHATK